MAEIRPFCAIRPKKGYEARVAALPYDVFSAQEAKEEIAGEPLSFLAIDRPEILAREGEKPEEAAVRMFRERMDAGVFVQDEVPCFYIYELTAYGRTQTGLCALTAVDDYLCGSIHKHENTRADKQAERERHVESLQAQTGPIFLVCRRQEKLQQLMQSYKEDCPPLCDFTAGDGVRHRLWKVEEPDDVSDFYECYDSGQALYIADGHHRCAAAVSYALKMRREHPDAAGEAPWNFVFSVLFPEEEVEIRDYNRVVKDLNGLSQVAFLNRISRYFHVEFAGKEPFAPQEKGMFAMYVPNGWYTLYLKEEYKSDDPVEGLDAALLQKYLLAPVLGITKPRTDERIFCGRGARF